MSLIKGSLCLSLMAASVFVALPAMADPPADSAPTTPTPAPKAQPSDKPQDQQSQETEEKGTIRLPTPSSPKGSAPASPTRSTTSAWCSTSSECGSD